nr:hypothetical protein CFP56_12151 [Quercus suber]
MAVSDVEKQPLMHNYGGTTTMTEQEPSLAELQQNVVKAQRAYMKAWHERTSSVWHRRIMYCVTTILILFFGLCMLVIAGDEMLGDDLPIANGKVALEAHIMSKCPDAKDCLKQMILPAMQNISDKVDFKLSYIGR